ncbi:MAG: hypothetical protein JHC33_01070 [Ignisphaera sp.]|nr:hypothetical protein [Ignisphaera sp.]
MANQNHPLAFLAEATYTSSEEHARAVKKAKDTEQIAINKRKLAEDEAERQRVLADFNQDDSAKSKIAQLGDTEDFVEIEGSNDDEVDPEVLPTYAPAAPRDTRKLVDDWPEDGWQPSEDELTGKDGPREPEVEPSASKVPEALMDFRIRLVSRIITLDEIKRLEKLLRANESPKPKLVKAGPWADTARKPVLKDLFTALKEMVNYLTESPSAPVRVTTGLTDSIKALQRVIAALLPKE